MNIYAMKRIWFKICLGVLLVTVLGAGTFFLPKQAGAYSEAPKQAGVIITVTYSDPINVRGGPSTVYYSIVGQLFPGDTAPALGVSPKREWVQISYPGSPTGTGWVYAAYVTVSGGELPIVEAPPTATPLATSTIDPTLAAAFSVQPTQTRLPTFTPPPPLTVPSFENDGGAGTGNVLGIFIIGLGLIGSIGLLVSFLWRK
jgi:uncharacterized protein YraI